MKSTKDKPVSIKEVALEAGVSISTVSNALRGTKYVSPELKEKIFVVINRLNYEVNPVASSLKSQSTRSIGMIIPNINRIFFPEVIKGIQELCARLGYAIMLFDTDGSFERERKCIHMLRSNWTDGIILDSVTDENDRDYLDTLSRLRCKKKPIPVVSLEREFPGFAMDSVRVDNYQAGRLAARHLVECGCKNIVHITGPAYSCMARARMEGCRDELTENSLPALAIKGDFSPLSGYTAVKKIIESRKPFDSIFAANDQMGVGALKAFREHNLSVPGDVKLVGFDNTFVASLVSPSLTTINVPRFQMGLEAAKLIIRRIENPEEDPVNVLLPTGLIIRESTRGLNQNDWELSTW